MSKSVYIPQKVSEVTIPITNKYGKLKSLNEHHFVARNELPLTSEILFNFEGCCNNKIRYFKTLFVGVGTKVTAFGFERFSCLCFGHLV